MTRPVKLARIFATLFLQVNPLLVSGFQKAVKSSAGKTHACGGAGAHQVEYGSNDIPWHSVKCVAVFDKSSTTGYPYIDERERELANFAHQLEFLKLK